VGSYVGVVTTGIYCCPGECSGRPRAHNRRWFDSPAAAEAAGYRACHLCRPYRTQAGWWLEAPELVCRALHLVLDGALDGGGTEVTLASRVGVSPRHLRRLFLEHVGVTPGQLARSARAHFARRLLDDTDLGVGEIAYLAAFGSVRQFNTVMRDTFRATPTELRSRRRRADRLVADGGLAVRLPFQPPLAFTEMLGDLRSSAIPGVETVGTDRYLRTIDIAGDTALLEIGPAMKNHLFARFHLPHWEGLLHLVQRARRIFDLDTDPTADGAQRRIGTWEPFEIAVAEAVRTLVPVAADDVLGGLVEQHGTPVNGLGHHGLTHRFPRPDQLDHTALARSVMPTHVTAAVGEIAHAVASGGLVLDRSVPHAELIETFARFGRWGGPVGEAVARRLGLVRSNEPALL
jgi:AraC family transcriptional regulator, regulatory protein of adaptative response / DNA-3-methyladenine glycosylase II